MGNNTVPDNFEPKLWSSWNRAEGSEAVETQEFSEEQGPVTANGMSRRNFMALMSASAALAAASCRRPDHKLVPSVKSVEYQIPGLPYFYTSVFQHKNAALGILVKTREGRPVKIEGNDLHPVTAGRSTPMLQASLLSLYDPDRVRLSRINTGSTTPKNAVRYVADRVKNAQVNGKAVRVLIDEHCSPSYAALVKELESRFPAMKFVMAPSVYADGAARANQSVFGVDGEMVPDLSKADVIVSVDADFLGIDKYAVLHGRNFASKRKPSSKNPKMNRLVVFESRMSLTGANADERIRVAPQELEGVLAAILGDVASARGTQGAAGISPAQTEKARAIAKELVAAGDRGVVLAGAHLSPAANALAASINQALGSVGAGKVIDPANVLPFSQQKSASLVQLRNEIQSGQVDTIIFADVNTAYTANREMRELLEKVPNRISFSQYNDETAMISSVNIPTTHYLESWGDAVSFDGTVSIQQPMIAPLNEGMMSLQDIFIELGKNLDAGLFANVATYGDYIRNRYLGTSSAAPAQAAPESAAAQNADTAAAAVAPASLDRTTSERWEKMLSDGVFRMASFVPAALSFNAGAAGAAGMETAPKLSGMVCMVVPSYSVYDGEYANNAWLQELPDPITKATWDNVASISKATADQLGVTDEDVIRVSTDRGEVALPVYIQPGMADNLVVVTTGYGRTAGGKVMAGIGANVYQLLGTGQGIGYIPVKVAKTGDIHRVATTQHHFSLEDRPIYREAKLGDVGSGKFKVSSLIGEELGQENKESKETSKRNSKYLIPINAHHDYEYKGHKWGMAVDLSTCIGCNACVTACQAENNIPTVGKDQVLIGREMHWIRIDRYYGGDVNQPDTYFQPMLCQHCENAPCENVCPVAATTHSPEGLNEMTYNRCVGTRYCSNNCPYKVRRFNFLSYHTEVRSPIEYVFNPDVTVRMRGVMEKCTFCVQRINEAKYHAKDQGRTRVLDGEVVTACAQACPANAIIFGDLNDMNSKVHQDRENERSFLVLEDLNTRPAVAYMAKVRNKA